MKNKQRLFIYDRKELAILALLAFMLSVFTFTIGVHYAKRITHHSTAPLVIPVPKPLTTIPDQTPNRQELTEQAKGAQQAIDETLNHELHDEVTRTGIKLNPPRQVTLPEETKSKNAGATTLHNTESHHQSNHHSE